MSDKTIYDDLTQLGQQTGLPETPEEAVLERVPQPTKRHRLRRPLHSPRIHIHVPAHRPARLRPFHN